MNEAILLALLIFSFGVIIAMVASKKNFAVAILLGSLILGLAITDQVAHVFMETATDASVLSLIAIVLMIKFLATVMQESGQIRDLILTLQKKLSYSGVLIAIPSILGLLPVPGGALMSAPLVHEQGEQSGMKKGEMMFINLWYRHIWFLIFPLSPPLVLIADLSGINLFAIIAMQIPLFALAFFVGYLFVRKFPAPQKKEEGPQDAGNLQGLIPILLTVLLATALSLFVSTYTAFMIALPLGIVVALLYAGNVNKDMIKKGVSVSLGVAIFGIMFFKNIIFASGVTDILSSHLTNLPLIVTITSLSFTIGFLTAHNLAAIGILYPIFSPFLTTPGLVSLLYISSFMGYLISPIHPCVVLSYEYFRPGFLESYKILAPPAIAMVISAALIYGLW